MAAIVLDVLFLFIKDMAKMLLRHFPIDQRSHCRLSNPPRHCHLGRLPKNEVSKPIDWLVQYWLRLFHHQANILLLHGMLAHRFTEIAIII